MIEQDPDKAFAAKVSRGIFYATPTVFVLTVGIVWAFTGLGLGGALRVGALPGVLFGVFAGGLIGALGSVWNEH